MPRCLGVIVYGVEVDQLLILKVEIERLRTAISWLQGELVLANHDVVDAFDRRDVYFANLKKAEAALVLDGAERSHLRFARCMAKVQLSDRSIDMRRKCVLALEREIGSLSFRLKSFRKMLRDSKKIYKVVPNEP